ncbi:MAG TPA: GNAT family N-acetyltransferase [Planctomycetota bacterium]|nr:GNAT family N-acetyltransferase [Planctomycetota bacterium]
MTAGPAPAKPEQLQMLWPAARLASPPEVLVADGYRVRALGPAEAAAHAELMRRAGFADWTAEKLAPWLLRILPDGLFGIEHLATGALAATAMATHNPSELHPFGGELGWVAGDPAHNGRGLGQAVCAAVVSRFLRAGYRRIYLKTDDWRLPAVKSYLRLGFVPFLHRPEMAERWREVCARLGWPCTAEEWISNVA